MGQLFLIGDVDRKIARYLYLIKSLPENSQSHRQTGHGSLVSRAAESFALEPRITCSFASGPGRDVARIKEYVKENYRKGRGRKPKPRR